MFHILPIAACHKPGMCILIWDGLSSEHLQSCPLDTYHMTTKGMLFFYTIWYGLLSYTILTPPRPHPRCLFFSLIHLCTSQTLFFHQLAGSCRDREPSSGLHLPWEREWVAVTNVSPREQALHLPISAVMMVSSAPALTMTSPLQNKY